jgi:beta-N-acetylhexosaminidase
MGIALGKGLSDSGIIPVYKHFPGHGDTNEDSHYTLPILNKTKDELYNLELKPFIDAIKGGAKVIMVGHIALPQITGDNTPASLSSVIVKDLLIDELGFKGVVTTDALNMGALTKNYTAEKILINAINAGVDMLLMPGSSKATITMIEKALNEGKITEDQINNSVRKILTLKYESGLFDKKDLPNKEIIGNDKHQKIIDKISQ